jgi:hypothetical protein
MEALMYEPARASDLMFDQAELACRARTTLAGADCGVLVVAGGRSAGYHERRVAVADDGGEPVLEVGNGESAPSAGAHAALMLAPNEHFGVGLTLIGRLAIRPVRPELAEAQVALTVERVLVSCPQPGSHYPHREISLDAYAGAEPDPIAANGWRIARHLTESHQQQVRGLAAHCLHRPIDEILAAQLSGLTARRLELWSVDESGAHHNTLNFEHAAGDLTELAFMVRSLLAGHPSDLS